MRLTVLAVVVAIAALAGCSSERKATPPDTFPETITVAACSDQFATGATVADLAYMNTQCLDEAGGKHVYSAGTTTCSDGRVLLWNDQGWAFAGETLTTHPAGAEKVAPASVRSACSP